ncbi:MAG: hypothetical protein IPJ69_04850 [Deltaproteobacteria bacterium]|nr:MAG: hypothetical protein IPJ69_04850 [Deltaproteobacteria bacterium]
MLRTIEAIIEKNGNVRFVEPLTLTKSSRAIVTILDEPLPDLETAHLAEPALSDWLNPEEDIAWKHLQNIQKDQ